MADADLVDRLTALSNLAEVPREELEWLVANGDFEVHGMCSGGVSDPGRVGSCGPVGHTIVP